MIYVRKGASPVAFETWKAQSNENWSPTYAALKNPEKKQLHETLLTEQGWLCCYCGKAITLENSHIEHFRPQRSHQDLQLSFDNLYASCMKVPAKETPTHCGHAKGNVFDEGRCISPSDPTVERHFMYRLSGHTYPSLENDARAEYMIELLQLNSPALFTARKTVLELVFDPTFIEKATREDLIALQKEFKERDANGKAAEFGHVLARFAEVLLSDENS